MDKEEEPIELTLVKPGIVNGEANGVADGSEPQQEEMVRARFFDILGQTGLVHILFAASLLMTAINIVGFILVDYDSFRTAARYLLFGITIGLVVGIAVVVQSIVEKGIYFRRKAEP